MMQRTGHGSLERKTGHPAAAFATAVKSVVFTAVRRAPSPRVARTSLCAGRLVLKVGHEYLLRSTGHPAAAFATASKSVVFTAGRHSPRANAVRTSLCASRLALRARHLFAKFQAEVGSS